MTGQDPETREALDTLLAALPTAPAPVAELLTRGRTRRRRRTALGAGLAATVVVASLATATVLVQRDGTAGGGTTPVAVDPSADAATTAPAPITLDLSASAGPSGPRLADGVLTRVRVKATVPGTPGAVVGREGLPWRHQVPGLVPGVYVIVGEVLEDGRTVSSCRRTVTMDESIGLDLVFRAGEACSIRVPGA